MKPTVVATMISDIFFPAQLFNFHFIFMNFVHIKSVDFILQFISIHIGCLSILLPHFTLFFPLIIFVLNFVFSLPTTFSIPYSYYFSPIQTHKTNILVNGHLISFFPNPKIPVFSFYLQQSLFFGVYRVVIVTYFSISSLDLH